MGTSQNARDDQPFVHGFWLESLEIDPDSGLVSGPGGRERLDPKVMAVLVLMTRQSGQVVSRDELLARLWPNRVVTDDVVTRCFCVLRRQLSQAGGDRRFRLMIETLPKRGYRLNGEIARREPQSALAPLKPEVRRSLAFAIAVSATIVLFLFVTLG